MRIGNGGRSFRALWKRGGRLFGLLLAVLLIAGAGRQRAYGQQRTDGHQKACAESRQQKIRQQEIRQQEIRQQEIGRQAETKDQPAVYVRGPASGISAAGEKVEQMMAGLQALAASAVEKAEAAKEAQERALSYDFTLGFAGDICLADNYIPMQHLEALGSKEISDGIDPRYIEIMQDMDLMWINNEFVYSRRGAPLDGKAWTFCGDPDNVSYLKDLGVDIVGLANNHTFDFGEESFLDTLSTLEDAEIPYVGAGRNIEQAQAPVYLETNGFRIAYVAASRAEYTIYTPEATETEPGILWCYDYTRFLESIRTAAANADFVIALPHWGVEHSTVLEEAQINGAYACIDAGADAVIGAHPHILQGIEYYRGRPILYSLGNFWFDDYDIDTMVARLRIQGKRASADASLEDAEVELKLYPGTQTGVYTGLADTKEWKSRILQYLEGISVNVTIDEDGVVHERHGG